MKEEIKDINAKIAGILIGVMLLIFVFGTVFITQEKSIVGIWQEKSENEYEEGSFLKFSKDQEVTFISSSTEKKGNYNVKNAGVLSLDIKRMDLDEELVGEFKYVVVSTLFKKELVLTGESGNSFKFKQAKEDTKQKKEVFVADKRILGKWKLEDSEVVYEFKVDGTANKTYENVNVNLEFSLNNGKIYIVKKGNINELDINTEVEYEINQENKELILAGEIRLIKI